MFRTSIGIRQLYKQIDPKDHQERLLFYERYHEQIATLPERDYHYMLHQYVESLQVCGKHHLLLKEIDPIIEYTFLHDEDDGDMSFDLALSWKVNALYQSLQYEQAIDLCKQLVAIKPKDIRYQHQLQRAIRAKRYAETSGVRVAALLLIFLGAISSAVIAMYVSYFKPTLWQAVGIIVSPCMLAMCLVAGSFTWIHLGSWRTVQGHVQDKKIKKLST